MNISDSVIAALKLAGLRQKDLAEMFGKTKQSMSTKVTKDQWFARDLVRVANLVGADLAFVFPNGTKIKIDKDLQEGERTNE